jgi:hypothetical protein
MPKKILELDALVPDRLAVEITSEFEGTKLYELKDKSEIGIENLVTIGKTYKEITRIQNLTEEEFDEAAAQQLSFEMDKFCKLLILDCPNEVHRELQDHHRMRIIEAFRQAVGEVQPLTMNRSQKRATAKK